MHPAKLIAEFIGTFFLMATIALVVLGNAGPAAPLAIGGVLIAMVFACGHVSGAHFNPAVTLAVLMRGKMPVAEAAAYMVTQVVAAIAAALTASWLLGVPPVTPMTPDVMRGLVAEALFTFALCYVVLNVAAAKGTSGNSFYGLAIGITVMAGAYAVGPISGGAFNPAVVAGLTTLGLSTVSNLWMYLVGQIVGAALAAVVFGITAEQT